ncbi:hypothetical protein B0T18DRAFT_245768 [Schizothecium vesticola]|uniref:Uncharacterized protein n=1 Tax=Schizothecium vesticola TaxID=314040 RepID=A0AA40BQ75_9PEZI|nr:hypothetical protein B0T18DRAFT_245768 [Schizothecium vesticola]
MLLDSGPHSPPPPPPAHGRTALHRLQCQQLTAFSRMAARSGKRACVSVRYLHMACINLGSACCRRYLPLSGLSVNIDTDEQRWRGPGNLCWVCLVGTSASPSRARRETSSELANLVPHSIQQRRRFPTGQPIPSSAGGICRAAPSQQHGRRHSSHERAEFGKPVVWHAAISPRRPSDEVRRLSDGSQGRPTCLPPARRIEKNCRQKKCRAGMEMAPPPGPTTPRRTMQASRFRAGSWVSRASMPRRPTSCTKTTTTGYPPLAGRTTAMAMAGQVTLDQDPPEQPSP